MELAAVHNCPSRMPKEGKAAPDGHLKASDCMITCTTIPIPCLPANDINPGPDQNVGIPRDFPESPLKGPYFIQEERERRL